LVMLREHCTWYIYDNHPQRTTRMDNIKCLMDDNYCETFLVLGKTHIVSCFRVTKSTCYLVIKKWSKAWNIEITCNVTLKNKLRGLDQ
jgi:hypothetical protein